MEVVVRRLAAKSTVNHSGFCALTTTTVASQWLKLCCGHKNQEVARGLYQHFFSFWVEENREHHVYPTVRGMLTNHCL